MPVSLIWLAVGAFAIGTESLMIAGLLPTIATDFHVSIASSGQLITVFAIAYAVGSPILSALCGNFDRRRLLVFSLVAFAVANLLAALSQTFWQLVFARVLLAFAAGLYMPGAYAVAASLVVADKRGRAVSIVSGGMSIATAFGVPLGAWIGTHFNWRSTFTIVAALSLAGVFGLRFGLPANLHRAVSTLGERLAVARRPVVWQALIVTFFWITSFFTLYTFIAPFLVQYAGIGPDGISAILFLYGIGAVIGNAAGGQLADRIGQIPVLFGSLSLLLAVYLAFTFATALVPGTAVFVIVPLTGIWGISSWAFWPTQHARLIRLVPDAATVATSLNNSALYAGIAFGSALAAVTMDWGTAADLGWVAAFCAIVAIGALVLIVRRRVRRGSDAVLPI